MQVPPAVIPILEQVRASKILNGRVPAEIWRAEDHRVWVDAFLELGCALFASDIPEEGLPDGYVLTAYLFDWEAQCQFSGWYALSNRSGTIDRVIECYRRIGLADESEAVKRAHRAWIESDEDLALTAAAYSEAPVRFNDLGRMEHMVCYLIDNADSLFYAGVEV